MKKRKLIWRKEEGYEPYLAFAYPGEKGKNVTDAAAYEYAEACDQDAENCNNHAFVGVHKKLLELIAADCTA